MRLSLLICVIFGLTFITPKLHAEDKFTFIVEKQKDKEKNRWSLAEWLDTRDRMRMMDLWLALHSPTPYEFFFGGHFSSSAGGGTYSGWDGYFTAYAYLFGVEARYQTSVWEPRLFGLVHFRAFGYHNQATNLTFTGGLKNESRAGRSLWNPVAGAELTLYLAKPVGVIGGYKRYFAMQTQGVMENVDRLDIQGFIDFQMLRLYAGYFSEAAEADYNHSVRGVDLGFRFYF